MHLCTLLLLNDCCMNVLYVNKIYIIFKHDICVIVCFYIIKIIYNTAINAILVASVLNLSLVTTRSIQLMAPLLADWAI